MHNRRPFPLRASALAALVVAGLAGLGLAAPAAATEDFALERHGGVDRYDTASKLAADGFATATDAVIARGDGANFADALAGSYLAGAAGGGAPLLLTRRDGLPSPTTTRLDALGVGTVHLLGGTGAVSQAVEDQLESDGYTVVRVQGTDRYDTAAKIATSQPAGSIGQVGGRRTAFLATGLDAADALAAGPVAYAKRLPILLTRPDGLPDQTRQAIEDLGIAHVLVLGGTKAVSDAVVAAVNEAGATTERIQGADRYATAAAVADFALTRLGGWDNSAVDLANGTKPADALAGGPVAGEGSRSIVLTRAGDLPSATRDWLAKMSGTLENGRVYGGTAVVADTVVAAAEAAGQGAESTTGTVTAVDHGGNTYTFVPEGASSALTVTYTPADTFVVGGQEATIAAFEGWLSVADTIEYLAGEGSGSATHSLTNVDPASINSGTVGNVDLADNQFDIIHPVTGTTLRGNVTFGAANTYAVDGSTGRTQDQFEADLGEGDTVALSGANMALTNRDVTGAASAIEKPSVPVQQSTRLVIGVLGDNPAAGTDTELDQPGQDDKYVANGPAGQPSDDQFAGEAASWEEFNTELTAGDRVTYRRINGIETFTLVNVAPATASGQAVDDLDADGDGNPLNGTFTDGGSFTLATDSGSQAVTYVSSGTFVLNGKTATEADVEAAYSPGDLVSFRPADAPSGTSQRLELTDAELAGAVDPASIVTADPPAQNANTYAVLAENGQTQLDRVSYADGSNDTYVVNGAQKNLEEFEAELSAIAGGSKTGTVTVTVSGSVQTHRLTTQPA